MDFDLEAYDFYMIDDGEGMPTVAECTYNGVSGYAMLVFTSEEYTRVFCHLHVPDLESVRVRKMSRRQVDDRLLQADLVRAARKYHTAQLPRPMVAMIVNYGTPVEHIVDIESVITHGLKQRTQKKAQDELFDE
jgi:hypothetical protein